MSQPIQIHCSPNTEPVGHPRWVPSPNRPKFRAGRSLGPTAATRLATVAVRRTTAPAADNAVFLSLDTPRNLLTHQVGWGWPRKRTTV